MASTFGFGEQSKTFLLLCGCNRVVLSPGFFLGGNISLIKIEVKIWKGKDRFVAMQFCSFFPLEISLKFVSSAPNALSKMGKI